MRRSRLYAIVCLAFVLPLHAQHLSQAAPVPEQILNGKRVFIANAPPAYVELTQTIYSGGPYRAYDQFYAAIKSWGRVQLVGSPADADLIFQVTQNDNHHQLELVILDPHSRVPLWWFSELLRWGTHRKDSDELYDRAIAKLVGDVQALVTSPPPAASSSPSSVQSVR